MITTMVHDHADRVRSYELIADTYYLAARHGCRRKREPMTTKADFNAEEWDLIAEGPALAGLIVITSQRGGTVRETLAMAKVYTEAQKTHASGDLVGELVTSAPNLDPKQFSSKEDMRTSGLQKITEAVALVEAKGDGPRARRVSSVRDDRRRARGRARQVRRLSRNRRRARHRQRGISSQRHRRRARRRADSARRDGGELCPSRSSSGGRAATA